MKYAVVLEVLASKDRMLLILTKITKSDGFYNLDGYPSIEADNYMLSSEDSGYTYQFRMDLSTPLSMTYDGEARIDKCIGWDSSVSPTNFTWYWYGISFQLPEDARNGNGGWNTAPAQPLKEDGYVQLFNDTETGVAEYNFTTSADRPIIRARINNGLLWSTFTFDFEDRLSSYVEQKSTLGVMCKVSESADGSSSTWNTVVNPTLTAGLERLSAPTPSPSPSPSSEPSSSSMTSSKVAVTTLALSAFFLLL
ncbi:hypothetical protein ACHAWC_005672 [Mediolabrus comicus]